MAEGLSGSALKTILITGGGGSGTIEIIKSLKGKYHIVAVDASSYAYGLKIADKGYVISLATDPSFPYEISKIISKEKPDYLIPLVDEEILPVICLGSNLGIKVLAPSFEFSKTTLDKWLTTIALKDIGLPVPKSWIEYPYPFGYEGPLAPFIGKPRNSRGSRGLVYNPTEPQENYIYQEEIKGTEFTVSVVVGLDNSLIAVVPKEVVIKKGITLVGITRISETITSVCREICDKLKPSGPFNVQLIMRDGIPYIIEINPRYSTTVALTIAAGINEVDLVIRHAEGEILPPVSFTSNLVMNRYYTQEYYNE